MLIWLMFTILICLIIIGVLLSVTLTRRSRRALKVASVSPREAAIPFISPAARVVFRRISADYILSPSEKRYLYNLLRREPDLSLRNALRRLIRFEGLADLKKFFMMTYLIRQSTDDREVFLLRTELDSLGRRTTDEETYINIRDYFQRLADVPVSPFRPQNISELPPELAAPVEINLFQGILRRDLENQERLLRFFEETHREAKRKPVVIYEQRENVHNGKINSSVITAARKLIDTYGSMIPETFSIDELRVYAKDRGKFEKAISRIMYNDNSQYGYERPFTLRDVFGAVATFISQKESEEQHQLLTILADELVRKSNKCGTGNLAALVSSIQGFQDDFCITLDIDDEVFARISKYFNDTIQVEGRDDIIEDMGTEKKTLLVEFVKSKRAALLDELEREYKTVATRAKLDETLTRCIRRYTLLPEV